MSRARKQLRDSIRFTEKFFGNSFEVDQTPMPDQNGKPERTHDFHMPGPNGQMGILRVKHGEMKRCNCGCTAFEKRYHVTWAKAQGVINAPPLCLQVEIFVCPYCGSEITAENPNIASRIVDG